MKDPITGEDYSRDPRQIARKAELYLRQTGIADTAFFGPEAEFYIFDSIRYDQSQFEGYYHIDSVGGRLEDGRVEEGAATSATSPATRAGTSRCRRWTSTRTCAPTWS